MPGSPEPPATDLAYSLALGGAMVATGVSWALWILGRGGRRWRRWGRSAAAVATMLVGLSLAVHLVFGHPPESERALRPLEFVGEHPAIFVVLTAALVGLWTFAGEEPEEAG